MQRIDGKLIWSAADLVNYLECEHLTALDLEAVDGGRPVPSGIDDKMVEVIRSRGHQHEHRYLETLKAKGARVVEIDVAASTIEALLDAQARTLEAMKSGADVVYQATFFKAGFRGHADFLFKVDRPSDLGPFSYEVADTKLATRVKARALLQMCAYSEALESLQNAAPEWMHVIKGDSAPELFRVADYAAYYRAAKSRLLAALENGVHGTYPEPVSHCEVCRWSSVCDERRKADDHLSRVANLRKDQAKKLRAQGIGTVEILSRTPPDAHVEKLAADTLQRLVGQARLQKAQERDGEVRYELLLPPEPERGLCLLPPPSPGDLFFDMEGDPLVPDGGLEYLFGVIERVRGAPKFHAFWAHDRAEERRAFEEFVDFVVERRRKHPELHVYHYASYEPSALKRLMGRFGTREDEIDDLLRRGVFVDLFQVVRQSLRVSQDGYGLKKLEPLYMEKREGEVKDAATSVVVYEEWLAARDPKRLADIASYNELDCLSTLRLRDWLEERREEAREATGKRLSRKADGEGLKKEAQVQRDEQLERVEALCAGIPGDPRARTAEQQATWLLAQLLEWHRREDRPVWWAYFERLTMTDEQLFEDSEALAGLTLIKEDKLPRGNSICEFAFDPEQEHKILEGADDVCDPATGKEAGDVVRVDNETGRLTLKKPKKAPIPRALIPPKPIDSKAQRSSIARVADLVAKERINSKGAYRAVRALLLRKPPLPGETQLVRPGEDLTEACVRLARELDRSYLPIQGPPGSGKTYTGARMVLSLVQRRKKVAITATSHKVIGNLLDAVCKAAEEAGTRVRILQKAKEHQGYHHRFVTRVEDNGEVFDRTSGFDVVAGTPWLLSREELDASFDVLFIDEAGQFSLANLVAVGTCATNLVLLGDPQQLAQPTTGVHPEGAGVSALEHVLGGSATIPADRGVFLERTWRMHPNVCQFVSDVSYERRLLSHPRCAEQRIDCEDPFLSGAGLRWIPVEHQQNRSSSDEEVEAVDAAFRSLLGGSWRDHDGKVERIGIERILVVTPYNAQVAALRARLPDGARVGTVDKFQGQEAPVTLYSMATSSADLVPRTLEFLYELNRLNVAVSRAKALSVLVCSPDLLKAHCKRPEQMRLVNALCRYVELAERSPVRSAGPNRNAAASEGSSSPARIGDRR